MIILTDKKIAQYLKQKDELVKTGRVVSYEIELIDKKIEKLQKKEREITGSVNPPQEMIDRGEAIKKQIDELVKELEDMGNKVRDMKYDAIPKEIKDEHEALAKEKDEKERERNKIALKVQKIKDKVIPIIRKKVKPLLEDRYDDIESAEPVGDEIHIKTFNHLEDWKAQFKKTSKR